LSTNNANLVNGPQLPAQLGLDARNMQLMRRGLFDTSDSGGFDVTSSLSMLTSDARPPQPSSSSASSSSLAFGAIADAFDDHRSALADAAYALDDQGLLQMIDFFLAKLVCF
jgi:hypothetical protein